MAKKGNELTEKEKMFCIYYLRNFNATQAYLKAYECSYNTAAVEGCRALIKPKMKKEIAKLKKERAKSISLEPDDILERYMRIAFSDITDFVEFGREAIPVMTMFGPLETINPVTGLKEPVTKEVNTVKFKESTRVDGGLICQIKQGKDGASLKLEDRQKALDWLANYFSMDPMNKHKQEYDRQRLALEQQKINKQPDVPENTDDGFIEALKEEAKNIWSDGLEHDESDKALFTE